MIVGTHADVRVSGVSISGSTSVTRSMESIFTTAFSSRERLRISLPPLGGSYELRDSRFSTVVSGTPVFNLKDANVLVENNTLMGSF